MPGGRQVEACWEEEPLSVDRHMSCPKGDTKGRKTALALFVMLLALLSRPVPVTDNWSYPNDTYYPLHLKQQVYHNPTRSNCKKDR